MAKKSKKVNKNLIIGICVAAVVVIAIIITVILVNKNTGLNDKYFVSDDTKYVLTLEDSTISTDEGEEAYNPIKTHLVYFYSGDEITGLKAYYEYPDTAAAKAALEYLKSNYEDEQKNLVTIDGKYVIYNAPASEYEELTASEVKEQIEFMELLKNLNSDEDTSEEEDSEDEEIIEDVDVEETTEE